MMEILNLFLLLGTAAPGCPTPCSPAADQAGPRFGVTVISGRNADRLREEIGVQPVITQFGWQFETNLIETESGLTAVTEWIPLVGGLEQGRLLPSISWLVGLRTRSGAEFGIGPNLSVAGTGLVLAAGATVQTDQISFPINLAVVPSAGGMRASLMTGFILRQ